MRVFVAGASGVIGTRLVPLLVAAGHEVVGTHHSPGGAERIRSAGATPVALDVLDAVAVRQAVADAHPDAIVHEATALANARFSRNLDKTFAETNRLRTEGTDALLAAAEAVDVNQFIAQSFANYRYAREGGLVKNEDDALDPDPAPTMRRASAAMSHLEQAVLDAGGVVLRYGAFYGAPDDTFIGAVRSRKYPLVGNGAGITSLIHVDDAAAATVLALSLTGPVLLNVTDDDPAPTREWLPALAAALGAKPPRHVPLWLARLLLGQAAVAMGESRGASNARAKERLGWAPQYPSWRQGFRASYRSSATA